MHLLLRAAAFAAVLAVATQVASAQTININANSDPKAAADAILNQIKQANANQAGGGGGDAEPEPEPEPTDADAKADTDAAGSSSEDGDDVVVLTDSNFADEVTADDVWLVEFYAPWCGHCKTLAPEYEKAATELKGTCKLGKVDATANEAIAGKHDIGGYPTLKIFKDGAAGKAHEYDGGRTTDTIVSKMKDVASGKWQPPKPPKDYVVTLTTDTFDDFIAKETLTLVEFYAPWCGHCKKLTPEFIKAADTLRKEKIKIAKVDATVEADLGKRFDVSGYPTLKIFRNGVASEYEGERTADGIASELITQSKPPAQALDTIFDTETLTESDELVIIGWFESEEDPNLLAYQEAATAHRKDYQFKYTTNPKVIARYKGAKTGDVTMFKEKFFVSSKYEAASTSLSLAGKTTEEIRAFFTANAYPLIGQRKAGESFVGSHKYDQRPLAIVYGDLPYTVAYRAESKVLLDQAADAANALKGKVTFAFSQETDYEQEMKDYGLSNLDRDLKVAFLYNDKTFAIDDDADIVEFINDAMAGNAPEYIKSAPKPKSNNGPVKVVVGTTFDEIVNDPENDVLIEFYAPWCGHCKSLEPKWKKLGKKLKKSKGIVIAKMDATANHVPKTYKVEGFPTIYLALKDDKANPVVFEGDREYKDFMKYLREKSSADLPPAPKKKKGKKAAAKDEL